MQIYRISLQKEGTPWGLFPILHQPLHIYIVSIITAKEWNLTKKIADLLHLKLCANQLSIF